MYKRQIKWLSNINMFLSIVLLGFFIIFGATFFGGSAMFFGIWDYLIALPQMSFNVWTTDDIQGSEAFLLTQWQGWWPVFYWAWW
ncbi:MAG: BCCT family transporter, partial [Sinobacterium sp.]